MGLTCLLQLGLLKYSQTDPSQWWWVSSDDNAADFTTRPTHPCDLGPESVWQRGPDYLYLPVEKWPISQLCNEEIPDCIVLSCRFY